MKRNTQHILDEWLVASAKTGDKVAFTRLVKRWGPKLLGYATSQLRDNALAQDVTQEVLIQISKSLTGLQDPSAFPKWAYQILQRRCVDAIRHRQVRGRLEQAISAVAEEDGQQTENLITQLSLTAALKNLTPELAQVVRLFYLDGFNANEIAEILLVPQGTVKSRLFTARQHLKNILKENDDD